MKHPEKTPDVTAAGQEDAAPVRDCRQVIPAADSLHVGIDVGGRAEKGFDVCITEWRAGQLNATSWKCVPHTLPLPPTEHLRQFVCRGDLMGLASLTAESACVTAAALWSVLEPLAIAGVHIDSPSAFSRNTLGHGRLCEKRSLTGVSFQSTPSIACDAEHGADWAWLVYGMIAFAACLTRGELSGPGWMSILETGSYRRANTGAFVLRECFPTATISVLRAKDRVRKVNDVLASQSHKPEVQAVIQYLASGVKGVKRPRQALYDRADALVAALGALPHVSRDFREVENWGARGRRWKAIDGAELVEGTFVCVE